MGLSSHSSLSPIRARASSARWRGSLRNRAPCRPASSSANWKPALCRVRAYSVPGLPRPTINLSGKPAMRIHILLNAAGRVRCLPKRPADEPLTILRLLLPGLLLGGRGLLLLLSLLGLA